MSLYPSADNKGRDILRIYLTLGEVFAYALLFDNVVNNKMNQKGHSSLSWVSMQNPLFGVPSVQNQLRITISRDGLLRIAKN